MTVEEVRKTQEDVEECVKEDIKSFDIPRGCTDSDNWMKKIMRQLVKPGSCGEWL